MNTLFHAEEVIIRLASAKDSEDFTDMMNAQYARKKTIAYFLWQFFSPSRKNLCLVALHAGKNIGFFGLQIEKLSNGETCGVVIDLIINPQFRGKGIFSLLEERACDLSRKLGASSLVCFPNQNGLAALLRQDGWKSLGVVRSLIWSLDSTPDKAMPQNQGQQLIAFSRDEAFFRWRFRDNPTYKYQLVDDAGCRIVSKIFSCPTTGRKSGDIVYYDAGESGVSFPKQIEQTIRQLRESGAEAIYTWCVPQSPFRPCFRSLGFIDCDIERSFVSKLLNENSSLYPIDQWGLMMADTEVY